MNKNELANKIAEEQGIKVKDALNMVEVVFGATGAVLAAGEEVDIYRFGKFEQRERAGRKGRNPQTGDEIDIAASKSVGFKPSGTIKSQLNG